MGDKLAQPPPYNQPMYPNVHQPAYFDQNNSNFQPQHASPQRTIIINKAQFGPFPTRVECPVCKKEVLTETHSTAGLLAWLLAGGLCLFGCVLGCCLIPCCIDSCRDVVHSCPSCRSQIALYKRL